MIHIKEQIEGINLCTDSEFLTDAYNDILNLLSKLHIIQPFFVEVRYGPSYESWVIGVVSCKILCYYIFDFQ